MKIFKFIPILFILSLYNSNSYAEKIDCSSIETYTLMGMIDKHRCKKGEPPREKNKFGKKLKKLLKIN